MRCCQAGLLLPTGLRVLRSPIIASRGANSSSPGDLFHLQPHYRSELPLDQILQKLKQDRFPAEKWARQIEAMLQDWTTGLLQSAAKVNSLERFFGADFSGSDFPSEGVATRTGPQLKITEYKQGNSGRLDTSAFLQKFRAWMKGFDRLLTADVQITEIQLQPTGEVHTRVRYEVVGEGQGFHREQRTGYWDLTWREDSSGGFRLRQWAPQDETRSVSSQPLFADATAAAFGANESYSKQLLRGTDYWRSVLDVACGIDVYGHNGVSVGDIDGDGFDDVYICQPGGLPNRLFRNRGDGTFEDITESAGVGVLENTASALFLDINNTGRQDLVVVRSEGPMLFLNQGEGKFRYQPNAFRFATPPQGAFTGAAAADYDRDGWLDIYFSLYVYYQGTDQYKYPVPYFDAQNGPPNFLMHNNRDGTFRDVTAETGLDKNNTRYSFCCAWNDYNQDGWPDLYVVNDFGRKNLYRNHRGRFVDVAGEVGVEDIGAGMSACWSDFDDNGAPDLYVGDMWTAAGERMSAQKDFKKDSPAKIRAAYRKHAMGNSLLRNTGQGTFEDATQRSGAGLGRWAWSCDAWDFDHDGFADLYVANGMISGPEDGVEQRPPAAERTAKVNGLLQSDLNSFFWQHVVATSPDDARSSRDYEQAWNAINELIRTDRTWSGYERNVLYLNNRDGSFSEISGAAALDFVEDGRSFALADFDHDGRQELLLKNRNTPQIRLIKNVIEKLPPAIAFRLRGEKSNRDAIGAVVTIETESGKQTRSLQAGSGFLSQHSKELFFGLGNAAGPVKATIRWPSGLVQEFGGLPISHRIWIEEGSQPSKIEPFVLSATKHNSPAKAAGAEQLPTVFEAWLLAPVEAPDFAALDIEGKQHKLRDYRGRPVLLTLSISNSAVCEANLRTLDRIQSRSRLVQLLTVNFDKVAGVPSPVTPTSGYSFPILIGTDDIAAVYSIVYRHLFDRRRDMVLPTSWLINAQGEIVKVYVGKLNGEQVGEDLRAIPKNATERMARALPFAGITDVAELTRNYLIYGSVFFQRGYMQEAEAAFSRAVHDSPESAEAQYGLGSAYLNQGKSAEAQTCFERAIKLPAAYPDTLPNAWNNLGLIAGREGRFQDAVSYFNEALKLSPDHVVAIDNLGNAYRQMKQWDESITTFNRALSINAEDPEANYGLGMVYAVNNETERAAEYMQKAVRARPVYPEALNNLGILYLRTQRRDEAVGMFKECIRVAPLYEQAYLNLARVYEIEGAHEDAKGVLRDLLKRNPSSESGREMLAKIGQ